jgi:hypothetical protein
MNRIEKNGIENAFYGNVSYGENYDPDDKRIGLQYSCNIHKNPGVFDLIMVGKGVNRPSIARYQGSLSQPANNTYTDLVLESTYPMQSISHENPIAPDIGFYSFPDAGGFKFVPPVLSTGNYAISSWVKIWVTTVPFNPANHCLSSISHFKTENKQRGRMNDEVEQEWRTAFNTSKIELAQAEYVYESTVNGGNTYALLASVQATDPQDAWDLRTELIDNSPLSDEIILQVIEEDILSNTLLLDVLVVNEHAARNYFYIRNQNNSNAGLYDEYFLRVV